MSSSDDLALLLAVIEEGSLSAAALRIGVSTAVVSRRLQAMEDRLGARLIVRTTRRLRPTDEGAALASSARQILDDIQKAEETVGAGVSDLRGPVRVLAPISFGRLHIAPALGRFSAQNPKVAVQLDLADRTMDMLENGYDLQISIGQPLGDSLIARRLVTRRRVICAAPSYWETIQRPETPDDLRAHECILIRRGQMVMDLWQFRSGSKPRIVRVNGRLSSNSGEITRAWALAGLGVALKSLWDVEEDLQAGRLVEALADHVDERAEIFISYMSRQFLPERVRTLLDFLLVEVK